MTTSTRFNTLIDKLKTAGMTIENRTGYIQSQCPCHDDKTPSVTIKENADGKITIKCHAGCDGGSILKEIGLNYEILYPEDQKKAKKEPRRIVATYPYTDEKGTTLYEGVRYYPKDFRQRVPLPNGKFKWSLKGVRRVIYNLPAVIDGVLNKKPIFMVEGEKDAQTLNKRGLIATTVPMGAGKWHDDYNKFFKDANVVILPDNDASGKQHAALVYEKIKDIAESVKIILLPELPPKGDVSDWIGEGNTTDELLDLAFTTEPIDHKDEAIELLELEEEEKDERESDTSNYKDRYYEKHYKIYESHSELLITDFAIEIVSIVYDDVDGRIFYIRIKELLKNKLHVTDTIEIRPDNLDYIKSFYDAIRPFTMGEIYQYKHLRTRPLSLFKWLLNSFNKPIVRRPDHVGFIRSQDYNKRPYWLFGNALICPPYVSPDGKKFEPAVVKPNENDEFIIDENTGFTLPIYQNIQEKEQLVPMIDTELEKAGEFLGELKTKLIELIGGGDPNNKAENYAKLLLGYVVYHLYENDLYYENDINGHSVMFYVFGPKGTGKTTYFNTILRAFFGLHKTKEMKGNTVSVPAIENQMGHFSSMPVCYDEFNPDIAKIDYQAINGYYHKVSRTVSDIDRRGRNKFNAIRSTLSITSNFRINLDVDQAEATESRVIYFEYKKEYRSKNTELFEWIQDNLDKLSRVTAYLLTKQTMASRTEVKKSVKGLYKDFTTKMDAQIEASPEKYAVEHRLTDNYSRVSGCYEYVFGEDKALRNFVYKHVMDRFIAAKANEEDQKIIHQIIHLAQSGKLKEYWHYNYLEHRKELSIRIKPIHETYSEVKREKAVDYNTFKNTLESYFKSVGGFECNVIVMWTGSYYLPIEGKVSVSKQYRTHTLKFDQINDENLIKDMFPMPERFITSNNFFSGQTTENFSEIKNDDDAPF